MILSPQNIRKTSIQLLFLSFLFVTEVASACANNLQMMTTSSVSLSSDNFPSIQIRIRRDDNNTNCNFFVVFENGGASSYVNRSLSSGGDEYPVQIYKDAGRTQIIKSLNEASSLSDTLSGTFSGSNDTTEVYYRPYIDPNTYLRFGQYSQNFVIKLYQGDLSSPNLQNTSSVTLSFNQSRKVDLSLVGTGAAFNPFSVSQSLNFGNLEEGATRSVDLVLGYNAGYKISVSSTNAGRIHNDQKSTTIPYTLTLNGSSVSLQPSPSMVLSASGVSPTGGQRIPIAVTIGNMTGAAAGTYTDTITFTVSSAD
ncbi:spore coat protein U domain-containing protein [Pseudobdellovibrio exovorus]|uniref:Spore coat protein U/FanG domain-containing protein n=1 Tax=Pseudobdellovibrio exovorus JSS TaxID=1184267 RepID=M4VAC8_9BACT|nr:spore coat protein U domain-containing protein [Pseudobdellovibrio exovorus]AGH96178.1 hypothetical protein A11Q_1962 [Pseudobdellovibrio exovorus JSS]